MKQVIYRGYNSGVGWVRGTAYIHFNDRPKNADVFNAKYRDFIFVQKFRGGVGFVAVDPTSVGVFTEAYDNHHNMIFEGDIVEVKGRRFEVIPFCNDYYLLNSELDKVYNNTSIGQIPLRSMKIVDNIYRLYDLKDK